ncbi:zinc-ribbon domain-containing protein [Frankia sp. EI5c]|uniref:zinc-ribbon domain-containing protein n=1 Tax=Frankia sp. EI5c TaxID=683316 RepID=UPI0037BF5B2C
MAPHLAEEFVCNVDNPGRDLISMPPGCNDACAWRCSAPGCGHEWIVPLYVRTLNERGCSKCGHKKTGADNSRPGPGESLAEVNPDVASDLVEVVNHAGWTAYDLLPFSNKSCLWRCAECDYEWPAPVSRRSSGGGCPECARKRSTAGRIRPKPNQSLLDRFPEIAAELIVIKAHPDWTAKDLRPSSTIQCTWECGRPDCTEKWDATPDQRTRRNGTGARCPVCYPRRKRPAGSR